MKKVTLQELEDLAKEHYRRNNIWDAKTEEAFYEQLQFMEEQNKNSMFEAAPHIRNASSKIKEMSSFLTEISDKIDAAGSFASSSIID